MKGAPAKAKKPFGRLLRGPVASHRCRYEMGNRVASNPRRRGVCWPALRPRFHVTLSIRLTPTPWVPLNLDHGHGLHVSKGESAPLTDEKKLDRSDADICLKMWRVSVRGAQPRSEIAQYHTEGRRPLFRRQAAESLGREDRGCTLSDGERGPPGACLQSSDETFAPTSCARPWMQCSSDCFTPFKPCQDGPPWPPRGGRAIPPHR
jgi:hypothetical protein